MQLDKLAFICNKCKRAMAFRDINDGCQCGNHLFVVARSQTGIPDTFNYDNFGLGYNPYKRKTKPGDGQGYKLTMPGNSEFGPDGEPSTGFGTEVRSPGDPKARGDVSMHGSEYEEQVKKDIDDMENTISFDGEFPSGNATPDGVQHMDASDTRFFDPEDSLGHININKEQEPVGPHNMQKGFTPNRRHFNRLTDNVFDEVRRKQRI
tara:strand:+ start:683 stop:1303 length:621 start_codon:yes stop_codon:yes gene_type:complete